VNWTDCPGGQGLMNIAHDAVDRHAVGPRCDHVALRWLGKTGDTSSPMRTSEI
jgi:acetyl-CoA synthetase